MTIQIKGHWGSGRGVAAVLVALGFVAALLASTPAEARVFIGFGFGFPIGFPYYYPPYPYGYYYPPPVPAYYPPPPPIIRRREEAAGILITGIITRVDRGTLVILGYLQQVDRRELD